MSIYSVSKMPARMACYGASGTGSQMALDLRYQAGDSVEFVGYIDDFQDPRRQAENGYPVMSFDEFLKLDDVGVFVPVLDPVGRHKLHSKLREHNVPILGARGLPHLVHPDAEIGEGTLLTSTTRLGHSTRVGRGGVVFAGLLAHDVEIGDFSSFGYNSVVLGHVHIGNGVFVGTGAIIQNGTVDRVLTVGDGAVIGAGAVVTHDVAPGEVMVGPRAMPLEEWRSVLGSRRDPAARPDA